MTTLVMGCFGLPAASNTRDTAMTDYNQCLRWYYWSEANQWSGVAEILGRCLLERSSTPRATSVMVSHVRYCDTCLLCLPGLNKYHDHSQTTSFLAPAGEGELVTYSNSTRTLRTRAICKLLLLHKHCKLQCSAAFLFNQTIHLRGHQAGLERGQMAS